MYVTHPVPADLRILDDAPVPAPDPDLLARTDALWECERLERPGLHDGRIFSLAGMEGGTLHGFAAPYRWHVARCREPKRFAALPVRSLAVTGLVTASGHLFFGLRKTSLAIEGGLWETVPAGTLHLGRKEEDGALSWRDLFLEELREELGVSAPAASLRPVALVEDTVTGIWELGVAVDLQADHRDVLGAWAMLETTEHSELAAVPLADVPRFVRERGPSLVGACPHLAAAAGFAPAL
ncbi:hypothetical protein NNJEOMEG_00481 [Fundidesulfovibrio magnetotacticus]|uniref:Nudix hydrolase domain-containing protein n=1 Tax=Fundidesulfovibrio magnetotacticus TaxID=2730080 RepID=A0A6V8LS91_9BACT|nr:hypothetical protein [Fundidesulfovibrio magnetotacticus]GFK92656.1 hypothetical protein NNJEOMEG_00481 [Fundidesulfovibrio magnetotacticus]